MKKYFIYLLALIFLLACNLPSAQTTSPAVSPSASAGINEPPVSQPQADLPSFTPTLSATDTPTPTATPQNPVVLHDTLCWVGPGNKYDVVSALKTGTRIDLIGRGTVDGWWVISNPIYKDPCWVQANDVQIEPGFDTSTLKLINPPPLPTPTWTPSITPTPHP